MLHLYLHRTHESLAWLNHLPVTSRITVFDQGEHSIESPLPPHVCIVPAAAGRGMSALMLSLLSDRLPDASPQDFAVFAPADPFPYAPAFMELLQTTERWGDVQPLSIYAGPTLDRPPATVAERDVRDWVGALPVRPERYSLTTLQPLTHHDPALLEQVHAWQQAHRLAEGESVVAAFLRQCGLDLLAEEALSADLGLRAHGPVWGMRHGLLAELHAHLHRHTETLTQCLDAPFAATLFDHLWLHLAGLPFVSLPALERPAPAVSALDESMARVVASIDAVLARSEPVVRHKPVRRAAAETPVDPARSETLVDQACLALQRHDAGSAVALARRALLLSPASGDALHTLATALGRTDAADEAIRLLDSLTRDDTFRDYRAQHPDRLARAHEQLLELMASQRLAAVDLALDA